MHVKCNFSHSYLFSISENPTSLIQLSFYFRTISYVLYKAWTGLNQIGVFFSTSLCEHVNNVGFPYTKPKIYFPTDSDCQIFPDDFGLWRRLINYFRIFCEKNSDTPTYLHPYISSSIHLIYSYTKCSPRSDMEEREWVLLSLSLSLVYKNLATTTFSSWELISGIRFFLNILTQLSGCRSP
jgi:hypothetical protein